MTENLYKCTIKNHTNVKDSIMFYQVRIGDDLFYCESVDYLFVKIFLIFSINHLKI